MNKLSYIFLVVIGITLSSCFKPFHQFSHYAPPSIPDYALEKNWAALPNKKDSADTVPVNSSEIDNQNVAQADVFYIYPTLNFSQTGWNANVDNERLNKRVDKYPIRMQASVFNGSCKVYSPRYRQATFASFLVKKGDDGKLALDLAYQDVKAAFDYYLNNYNHGRPFIIAGHSQGSRHAYRLLNEFINKNDTLRKKMIAAYAIGFNTDEKFSTIPSCDSASQNGCLISWNTYKWGATTDNKYLGENIYCTNPLSWKCDTTYISAAKNLGGVDRNFKLIPNACDAQVVNGIVWVHRPKQGRFVKFMKNYHVSDYSLFYMNIRENVATRVKEYLKINSGDQVQSRN